MKKLLIMLLVAILAMSTAAFAATYNYDSDITFEYDENAIEITSEDHGDDQDHIILGFKDSAWGDGFISILVQDIPDGQSYPTSEEIAEGMHVEPGVLENLPTWGNFTNVITASFTTENVTETVFIAPVFDDDGEAEEVLSISISVTGLEDEDIAMQRDDAISAIMDTLKVKE